MCLFAYEYKNTACMWMCMRVRFQLICADKSSNLCQSGLETSGLLVFIISLIRHYVFYRVFFLVILVQFFSLRISLISHGRLCTHSGACFFWGEKWDECRLSANSFDCVYVFVRANLHALWLDFIFGCLCTKEKRECVHLYVKGRKIGGKNCLCILMCVC